MKGKNYSTEDKIRILRQSDGGRSTLEVCREANISEVTFHPVNGSGQIANQHRPQLRTLRIS